MQQYMNWDVIDNYLDNNSVEIQRGLTDTGYLFPPLPSPYSLLDSLLNLQELGIIRRCMGSDTEKFLTNDCLFVLQ